MTISKKFYASLAIALITIAMVITPVFASSTTISGTLGGYSCSGYVNCNTVNATGSTSYGISAGLVATVTVRSYTVDGLKYLDTSTNKSANGTYVSTTTYPTTQFGYMISSAKVRSQVTNGSTWDRTSGWVAAS